MVSIHPVQGGSAGADVAGCPVSVADIQRAGVVGVCSTGCGASGVFAVAGVVERDGVCCLFMSDASGCAASGEEQNGACQLPK